MKTHGGKTRGSRSRVPVASATHTLPPSFANPLLNSNSIWIIVKHFIMSLLEIVSRHTVNVKEELFTG